MAIDESQQSGKAIFLMGPTASGKTDLAVEIYQRLPVELISVDSALVYKGMDIGTAKPDEHVLKIAPHHLIDIKFPTESYSAAQFRSDALNLMTDITNRGKIPLLVGGTMLYFNALQNGLSKLPEANPSIRERLDVEAKNIGWPAMHAKLSNIDPETASRLEPADSQRIQRALEIYEISGKTMTQLHKESATESLPFELLKFSLVPFERSILHERIAKRFDLMLERGFLDEVRQLLDSYPELSSEMPSMRCVGYRQALQYISGECDFSELKSKGIAATRQLAKRQLTWLRGMRDTVELNCLDSNISNVVYNYIIQYIG